MSRENQNDSKRQDTGKGIDKNQKQDQSTEKKQPQGSQGQHQGSRPVNEQKNRDTDQNKDRNAEMEDTDREESPLGKDRERNSEKSREEKENTRKNY